MPPFLGAAVAINYFNNLTQAQLVAEDRVLALNELARESDTGSFKFGDGVTTYSLLPYGGQTATETIAAAGALSVVVPVSKLALVGAGAVTLAAPSTGMLGRLKTVQMTTDNGDITMALTNVVGQSSGTTATFNDAGDALVLIGGASGKWIVVKEFGIALS